MTLVCGCRSVFIMHYSHRTRELRVLFFFFWIFRTHCRTPPAIYVIFILLKNKNIYLGARLCTPLPFLFGQLSYRFLPDNSAVVTRASNVLTLAQWNLAKFQSKGPVGTGLCLKVTLQCRTRQSLVNTSQTWYQSCCNFAYGLTLQG